MYNYEKEVKQDILDSLDENKEYLDLKDEDYVYNALLDDFNITGNVSGIYFTDTQDAIDAVADNFDLLQEAATELGYDSISVENLEPNFFDILIRTYVYSQVFDDAYSEYMNQ